jgi:spermidine/putrescine transport system permease protein
VNHRVSRSVFWTYFVVFVLFLFLPLAVLFVFAFNSGTTPTFPLQGFTTSWYRLAFQNSELTDALMRSVVIAIIASVLATGLGIMAAVGLAARRLALRSASIGLLLLPLVVPYISLAVGLLILLQALHLPHSLAAIVLGHTVVALPFAILVIFPRLRSLDASLVEAARDLGASSGSAFRLITLPLLVPALVSSLLICFTTSFDEFAIASFLYPSGQPTYPVFLYASARSAAQLPQVIAVGTIVIVVSILIVVAAEAGRRWGESRLEGRTAADAAAAAVDGAPAVV